MSEWDPKSGVHICHFTSKIPVLCKNALTLMKTTTKGWMKYQQTDMQYHIIYANSSRRKFYVYFQNSSLENGENCKSTGKYIVRVSLSLTLCGYSSHPLFWHKNVPSIHADVIL